MKLRKMITVSAAALMLAGVGASATNAGVPVHASRRTVRISRLRTNKSQLERQDTFLNRKIRSNKSQLKQINREMARLSRRGLRKGKRSKKNVKRHKRTRKHGKKNTRKAPRRVNRNKKLTPQQKKQQQMIMKQYKQQIIAAQKQRIPAHLDINGQVYKVTLNGMKQIVSRSKKPFMSMKAYNHKYNYNKKQNAYLRIYKRVQKLSARKDVKAAQKVANSKRAQSVGKAFQKVIVYHMAAPTKK